LSAPADAPEIALPIEARVAVFVASSATFAAGAPGVPAAASVAASAVLIAVSATVLAACNAPTAAKSIPRQAGKNPIKTFILPGPGISMGGNGWATVSVILAAGPVGIIFHSLNFLIFNFQINFAYFDLVIIYFVGNHIRTVFRFNKIGFNLAEKCFYFLNLTSRYEFSENSRVVKTKY
jgi:hypothetical protein